MNFYPIAKPFIGLIGPETAHRLTVRALAAGLGPKVSPSADPILKSTLWGRDFANPLGLAAGFDKHGEVIAESLALGFGFVEIGSITPRPQPGNPRPRLFRLTQDRAVINRYGFNSEGIEAAARRLRAYRERSDGVGIVGVNLGKNKGAADAAADYAQGAAALGGLADYIVVNVSSPNTPGLRALQGRDELSAIVERVRAALPDPAPPLLVKLAPDLTDQDKREIAQVALEAPVDGLIVGNTTTARPADLRSRYAAEAGGLSGRPLMAPSTALLAEIHTLTGGTLPIIGVGGVVSAEDAYAKIRAGASLVQLYTALVFEGPGLVPAIVQGLADLLRGDGFGSVVEAVGAGEPVR
ncbi:MAG TPA: quinone-dependent dihydroorotate dehydrogenase [Alphaproteobacteria bacterium]|nr:quinone-dependent dihydroorotate dehydrogenase [Alphaproteobacteria bacterium]